MTDIAKQKDITYGLDDEIVGDEGFHVRIDENIKTNYEKLVDTYLDVIGVDKRIGEIQEQIKSGEGELEKQVEECYSLFELKYMIYLVRDRALGMESFSWSGEKGIGIYKIKIKQKDKGSIYFKDIFDKDSGAEIEDIKQTVEMGQGMGIKADCDEYEIHILNKQKGIRCIVEWHY